MDPFAQHARFVDANLRRNYSASFIHGVLGMTGFDMVEQVKMGMSKIAPLETEEDTQEPTL